MRQGYPLIVIIALLASLFTACAPKTVPPPSVPQPSFAPPSISSTNLPSANVEDAAWAKIVAAARKEGKVNAYAFTWVGDIGLTVAKAFKERYGITLEITTGKGLEFTERIKTEKRIGQQVGDMTEGSPGVIDTMRLQKILASVSDDLPVLRVKGVWVVEPTAMDPRDKANLTWRLSSYNPYINTKLVRDQEVPQSWKDLLEPAWKGKMGLTDPKLGTIIYRMIAVLTDNKIWDEDYLRALYRQNLRLFRTGPDMLLELSRGDISLAVNGSDDESGKFVMEGAPIRAVSMKEGVVFSTASVAAIAGGPNPNAAKVFLNWLLSQEGQTVTGRAQGNRMVRNDVPDFRPEVARAPVTKPLMITVEQLDRSTKLFQEGWFDKLVGR